jgi:SHS2 domain-containing protein
LIRVPDNLISQIQEKQMVKVIYEGDDFKRMMRKDMRKLQQLVDSNKLGIFEVDYKEGKIKVEIKKKGDDIIVKRWRSI